MTWTYIPLVRTKPVPCITWSSPPKEPTTIFSRVHTEADTQEGSVPAFKGNLDVVVVTLASLAFKSMQGTLTEH